jgi:hypothetical protein
MVICRISNIFDDIENERCINLFLQVAEAERLENNAVDNAIDSLWMELDNELVEFGLECTCGHIEVAVWDNPQCSSCGAIIEIGDMEIDSNCFQ